MIAETLCNALIRVWEYLTFWWYYPPALSSMRLKGPARDGDENALMVQFFTWEAEHPRMSWWKHFETEVPNLAAMGVSQVWLPPPNKAMRKQGQGYDAYDLWDLGEFYQKGTIATRWGTKEELVRAVATANAHGIDVLVDAVLNHKLGADRLQKFNATPVDPNDRLRDIGPTREIEGWTGFDFNGRAEQYSSLKWTPEHFTGDNHKGWSEWVDGENGNYDYLLGIDIDHRHPDVRKDLMTWGNWVLQTTGGAGFRLDAIKHMDRRFLLSFIKHVRETLGRPDLFSVAEYWSADLEQIKPYIRVFQGLVTFFDVPLHHNFHQASKAGSNYDLRKVLDNSIMKFRPGDAVTFQIGQTLESWVGANFKLQAYALVLLYGEGHPCVFYGDLYTNEECYDPSIADGLKRLMTARKKFAYGARTDYFSHPNCIGFVRQGDPGSGTGRGGCAVLLSNADVPEEQESDAAVTTSAVPVHTLRINVGSENAGATYCGYLSLGNLDEAVRIDADGWGAFTCPLGGLQVWVRANSSDNSTLE
ncbi:alpha amylase [Ganoderma leucocontextum]|nr:alpha amylase [Ganoderma leucocontextum]